MDWLDTYSDPSVKAASVVTNLWIAAFAITSALFALLGAVVAIQWPNPRILCYKTSYSDMPSNSLRSCCSLYSLNLGFTVFWLLVFAIMVIARDVVRIIICLGFWIVHVAVVVLFRLRFKRFGRPERPFNASLELGNTGSAAATASLGPGQAVGIPVYNIPMQEVVIGPRVDGTAAGAGTPSSQPPPYWYDADCLPPAGSYPYGAPGSAAVGAAAGPTGGVQGPYPVGPYPTQAAAYPPQPAAATAGAGADGFVLGQPVTGIPAMAAPQMGAAAGQAGGRASMEASGHVGAAAGAAAAAGAGAVGAGGQQPPR